MANLKAAHQQSVAGMTIANMSNIPQQSILPQAIVKTGRPIVNTTNLAANNLQPHQVNTPPFNAIHQSNLKISSFCFHV